MATDRENISSGNLCIIWKLNEAWPLKEDSVTSLRLLKLLKFKNHCLKVFNTEKRLYHFFMTLKVFNIEKGLHHFLQTLKGFNFEKWLHHILMTLLQIAIQYNAGEQPFQKILSYNIYD